MKIKLFYFLIFLIFISCIRSSQTDALNSKKLQGTYMFQDNFIKQGSDSVSVLEKIMLGILNMNFKIGFYENNKCEFILGEVPSILASIFDFEINDSLAFEYKILQDSILCIKANESFIRYGVIRKNNDSYDFISLCYDGAGCWRLEKINADSEYIYKKEDK